jgi:sugar/nucleoside kinase (ribokinase family)
MTMMSVPKRINCLGVLVVDALDGPLAEYPAPRRRPQVVTQSVRFAAGGGAANTGGALARMGLNVGVFSKVGRDPNGEFLRSELARVGVDARGIRAVEAESTPFTFVGIHPDGDRTFIHTPGTNLSFSSDDLDLKLLFAADILLYQDCWVLPRRDGEPGARLLAEARRRGLHTALDECWGLGPRREALELMLPHCDYFLPSLEDLRAVYPDWTADRIAAHCLALGAGAVVLKLGAEGCLVARGAERTRVPALPAKVVDTTGAGDCWDAGFLAGLLHGADALAAARLGHACAAYCIEQVGGSAGVPAYAQVCRRAGLD